MGYHCAVEGLQDQPFHLRPNEQQKGWNEELFLSIHFIFDWFHSMDYRVWRTLPLSPRTQCRCRRRRKYVVFRLFRTTHLLFARYRDSYVVVVSFESTYWPERAFSFGMEIHEYIMCRHSLKLLYLSVCSTID